MSPVVPPSPPAIMDCGAQKKVRLGQTGQMTEAEKKKQKNKNKKNSCLNGNTYVDIWRASLVPAIFL